MPWNISDNMSKNHKWGEMCDIQGFPFNLPRRHDSVLKGTKATEEDVCEGEWANEGASQCYQCYRQTFLPGMQTYVWMSQGYILRGKGWVQPDITSIHSKANLLNAFNVSGKLVGWPTVPGTEDFLGRETMSDKTGKFLGKLIIWVMWELSRSQIPLVVQIHHPNQ